MDEMLSQILDCLGPKHGAIKDLANHLNISPNVITNWKNGSSRSYRKYVHQIAEYFGVSTDYLLGKEKEPATDSDGFTPAERRDIAKEVERMMADLEHQGDLMFDGDPATPEALESIRTAFMIGLTHARQLNKQGKKYKFPNLPERPKEE